MQATVYRSLTGRSCRPAAAAAAVQQKQRHAQPRPVRAQVSADVDRVNGGNRALEEYQSLEMSGSADFASLDRLR